MPLSDTSSLGDGDGTDASKIRASFPEDIGRTVIYRAPPTPLPHLSPPRQALDRRRHLAAISGKFTWDLMRQNGAASRLTPKQRECIVTCKRENGWSRSQVQKYGTNSISETTESRNDETFGKMVRMKELAAQARSDAHVISSRGIRVYSRLKNQGRPPYWGLRNTPPSPLGTGPSGASISVDDDNRTDPSSSDSRVSPPLPLSLALLNDEILEWELRHLRSKSGMRDATQLQRQQKSTQELSLPPIVRSIKRTSGQGQRYV